MIRLLREQNRLENQMALLMLAGLVGNIDSRDLSNVMAGAQFYKIAKMSGYGQLAEQDADTAAVKYMKQAGFNPVGMLTFLERMAERPDVVNWGIMQTHPRTDNRVRSIKAVLAADGTEINRRAVTSWSTAKVKCIDSEAAPCYEVMIAGRTVCRVADQTRASEAATRINAALDAGLQLHQVRVVGNQLEANGQPILAITDQDLALSKQTANAATLQAAQAVRCVLLRDIVNDIR
jgi:predicted Zn-dependent protease